MSPESPGFLDEKRLLLGPWQALERDIARILIANGFEDVRIVAGSGDRGGDVIGVSGGELWVFQCKYTSRTPAPADAIREVVEAGKFYKANRLLVAASRPPGGFTHGPSPKWRSGRVGAPLPTAVTT